MRITHYGFKVKRKAGDQRPETWSYCGAKYPENVIQDWKQVNCKLCHRKRVQVQNKTFEDAKREQAEKAG